MKNLKKNHRFSRLFFIGTATTLCSIAFLALITSCSQDSSDPNGISSTGNADLQFEFASNNSKSKSAATPDELNAAASHIMVSIEKLDGGGNFVEQVYTNKIIQLQRFGSQIISLPLSLATPAIGSAQYRITNFSVLNSGGAAIMSTPIAGSSMEHAVPVGETVPKIVTLTKDQTAKQVMYVVEINSNSNPGDFGYTTFTFNVSTNYQGLIVAPKVWNGLNPGDFVLTPAVLEIWQQDGTNLSNLRTPPDLSFTSVSATTISVNMPVFADGSLHYRVRVTSTSISPTVTRDTIMHKDDLKDYFAPVPNGKGALVRIMN